MRLKEILLNNIEFIVYEDGTIKRKSDGFQPAQSTCRKYKRIEIWSNGLGRKNRKRYYVHRVVACAFLDLPLDSKLTVDHLDGNGLNNHLSNMEVVTGVENIRRAGNSYKIIDHVDQIKEEHDTGLFTYQEIADSYGVQPEAIRRLIRGVSYKKRE